jgi:hypothetical protein
MPSFDQSLDTVIDDLRRSTNAALELVRQLAAARRDPDEWLRFPAVGARCPISGWSRQKIDRLTRDGRIRRKSVGTSAFYSAADLRVLLNK